MFVFRETYISARRRLTASDLREGPGSRCQVPAQQGDRNCFLPSRKGMEKNYRL